MTVDPEALERAVAETRAELATPEGRARHAAERERLAGLMFDRMAEHPDETLDQLAHAVLVDEVRRVRNA